MSSLSASKGNRLQVVIFGRINAGKSSLMNLFTGSTTSIVSGQPGTTTDPVEKAVEVQPLGPVLFVDTAGLDDAGVIGAQRVRRSRDYLRSADLAVLVVQPGSFAQLEEDLVTELRRRQTPILVVFGKADLGPPSDQELNRVTALNLPYVAASFLDHSSVEVVTNALRVVASASKAEEPPLISDLLPPGGLAVLVVPIDPEAPKGRLILPQVQTIRDALDHDAMTLVVKERELRAAMDRLKAPPDLVVTDSQAFLRAAADVPTDVPLTSFSILFARLKGDLRAYAEGARAIERLASGSRVLIAEACSHHAVGEDIGTVKIPRWLSQYAGAALHVDHARGAFPQDLASYDLVVQCGGCTKNRKEILGRIEACREHEVPITNYGLCIAYSLGIFERALAPFRLS
ncbi:MAG: [FeFe] hydrogenase H-cluster maturation GTPase HydF [Myxococcales bacterium]|nr:[FeFe] hydrogenase H-cluster maturation GTPase HydF [Myxococcales bacterium]